MVTVCATKSCLGAKGVRGKGCKRKPHADWRGANGVCEETGKPVLAETEGFEPSIPVYAGMLP